MALADFHHPAHAGGRTAHHGLTLSDLAAGLVAAALVAGGLTLALSAPDIAPTGDDLDWHGNSATLSTR